MCAGKNVLLMPAGIPGVCLGWSDVEVDEVVVVLWDATEQRYFETSCDWDDLIVDNVRADLLSADDMEGQKIFTGIAKELALLTGDRDWFFEAQNAYDKKMLKREATKMNLEKGGG